MVAPYAETPRPSQPDETGTAVYIPVTNAIEALNAKLSRAVRARGHFPTDEAVLKLLYFALNRAEKEWTMPPRDPSFAPASKRRFFINSLQARR
jgi:transposase-like protein